MLVIYTIEDLELVYYIFETNKPIILLERLDSSITWCRNLERIKNLKAIFKNRIIRPSKRNNQKFFNGRYHSFYIRKLIQKRGFKIKVSNKILEC